MASPVVVIGSQYCSPDPMDLTVTEKALSLSDGDYTVTDIDGNAIMKVKGKTLSIKDRCQLLDMEGNPLVHMKQKLMSAHRKWEAFRGDSAAPEDLLFTVKKSHMIELRTRLDVFLASNETDDCDFKIKGSWFERNCTIFQGDSENIIAQMSKQYKVKNIVLGKDTFGVTVYPHVDYAFIVALIVILDQINEERD